MANLSKITLPNGNTYDLKDAYARDAIAGINSFEYAVCTAAANTPKDVIWTNGSSTVTGTLAASADTKNKIYLVPSTNGTKDIYDEYITINTTGTTYVWEMFGNTDVHLEDLGTLAKKSSASGSYTPAGTVSQPTFTGTSGSVSVSGTPTGAISTGDGTANYTPAGTLSGGAISVSLTTATKYVATSTTGGGSVTAGTAASCTLPSLSMSVDDNETLTMSWSEGSFTTNAPTVVKLPSFSSATVASGVKSASISTEPTFSGTGTQLLFTGDSLTSTGDFTPEGSVSQPTFKGTAKTVTVS